MVMGVVSRWRPSPMSVRSVDVMHASSRRFRAYSCSTSARAVAQHRFLVDGPFVGDLLRVDRRRLVEQRRRARTAVELPGCARGERLQPHRRSRRAADRRGRTAMSARSRFGNISAADEIALVPGDDDVVDQVAELRRASAARSGPTRTQVPVDSLKSSDSRPSNTNPLPGPLVDEAERIAEPVETLRRRRPRASARRRPSSRA